MLSIFSLAMLVEPSIPKTEGKLESALTGKYKSREATFAGGLQSCTFASAISHLLK